MRPTVIALVLLLAACSKSEPAAPDADPRIQLEKMGAVKMAPQPEPAPAPAPEPAQPDPFIALKVKAVTVKKADKKAEAAAYAKAEKNNKRAICLRAAVDLKALADVRAGRIQDWGNVITAPVCSAYK